MEKWEVLMDFGEQQVHVKKHKVVTPFSKDSPFLDLFDLGPVDKFDRSQVPKEFWLDSSVNGTENIALRDAKAYDLYRKRGGLYQPYGKLPTTPPVFPPRKSEGGYGKKNGYDDSLKKKTRAKDTRKATLGTEPATPE